MADDIYEKYKSSLKSAYNKNILEKVKTKKKDDKITIHMHKIE